MRRILVFLGMLLAICGYGQQSAHQYSVSKLEGGTFLLADNAGKKILIVTLPLTQSLQADSLLYSLDTLSAAHTSTLKVIAVLSIEDGYTVADKAVLLQWYRSKLGSQVIISDGIFTHKGSGANQHPLFKWMTNVSQNEVFDIDADTPGYKFFINGAGQLYGVLRPQSRIWGQSVQRTISMQ